MLTTVNNMGLVNRIQDLEAFIGRTPLYPIKCFSLERDVRLFAKLEWQQLGNSVKARPAFNIIKEAVRSGELHAEKHLLDASSGNTAVAYAALGAALGIPVTLCVPENASTQKKAALQFYGANIIYTSRLESTDGAQDRAKELASEQPNKYFYADQYANDNNWKAHYFTTGIEIYKQTEGTITHFVAGLGTTGTFTGTSRRLKELNKDIRVVSLHPDSALHGLEGWKDLETARIPAFYDDSIADEQHQVSTEKAYELIKTVAQKEGLLLSPSSAANLAGALHVARQLKKGTVVTVFPDHGTNYPEVLQELLKTK